ncbi:microcin-processing peptidase 2 [Candidatus Magnetoovum chiemensis]|nr:microcin-processing peptidase 2 [Candidatus Magnetoovum chiemensis]
MVNRQLCEKLLKTALSKGGEYADVYFEYKKPLTIELEDNKIEKISQGIESGVGIRLIFNKKTAYAYTNDISKDNLIETALSLTHAVRGSQSLEAVINLKKQKPNMIYTIKQKPDTVAVDDKIAFLSKCNNKVRARDLKIRQVKAMYSELIKNVAIANSDGAYCEDERVYTLFTINVIAKEGAVIQTGFESLGGLCGYELIEDNDTEELSLKAANRALMMLKAPYIKGGRMPVVISSQAGGTMIHEAIGHGLEADYALEGLSVYSNKKGQAVASKYVTVIDDGTIENKRGSSQFDDEGNPTQRNVLVEEGILKQYMYDKLSALKDGSNPTGNGRRQSYESKPIPRMTNTYLASGALMPDDIVKSVDNGLFVKKMGGGQVNPVTGDFVFDVQEGYMIKKGQIAEPVRGATLSGNGPKVLKEIDLIGNDLGFSIGVCGKDGQGVPVTDALPTIRIPDIVVGGKS